MIDYENLLLNGIYLLFPISLYLIYTAYMKNMDLKEKSIFLDLALISSLFLMIRYNKTNTLHSIVLYNIPLLLAYIQEKRLLSVIISILLIVYDIEGLNLSIEILGVEYLSYFILSLMNKKKVNYKKIMLNGFIMIKFFFTGIVFYLNIASKEINISNMIYVIGIMIMFIIYSYLMTYFLDKGKEMVDLKVTLKELEKEKRLRISISKLTHELKNPIAVCNGYLEMLDIKDQKKIKKYIPIIKAEINRSLEIINDFSDLGKINKLEKEEMDLEMLLEETKEILQPIYKNKSATIQIEMKEEIYIEADYNRLKQVFVNLLKNALEAKKEKEQLKVKVIVQNQKNNVKIKIMDNGIGMTKETLKHLSEIFYTTKRNGNGLGVAFSKEVIEAHGGTIYYNSAPNKGTTIVITLPKNQINAQRKKS